MRPPMPQKACWSLLTGTSALAINWKCFLEGLLKEIIHGPSESSDNYIDFYRTQGLNYPQKSVGCVCVWELMSHRYRGPNVLQSGPYSSFLFQKKKNPGFPE